MAGDWIKWTKGLPNKPEVIRMATALRVTREAVVCRLMQFWEWCDENVADSDVRETGSAFVKLSPDRGDNVAVVDSLVGTPGFADSLAVVGWIKFRDDLIELPNFGRHNGETAKTRARNAKNQQRKRQTGDTSPSPGKPTDVTAMSPPVSPGRGDKSVTRGEESREAKTTDPPNPPPGGVAGQVPKVARERKPPDPGGESVPIPSAIDRPPFRDVWAEWIAVRRERRPALTARAATMQLNDLAPLGPDRAAECVRASIKNQWQGLFPEKFRDGAHKTGFRTRTDELYEHLEFE